MNQHEFYQHDYNPTLRKTEGKIPMSNIDRVIDITPYMKSPILDVGCGMGYDAEYFASGGMDVLGIDINREIIIEANRLHGRATFELWNIEDEPYPSKVDTIYSFDVIEHIFDFKSMLKNMVASLHDGGHLILSTPNSLSLRNRIQILLGKSKPFDTFEHIRFFTAEILTRELEAIGMEVIMIKTYSDYPLPQGLGGSMTIVARKGKI